MKKVCVVGYGAIGPIHLRSLRRLENAKAVAICDIDRKKADIAAKRYGLKPFYDYDEMLGSGEVNSIHICTPHYLHKEMAEKALLAGCDVVLEKPAAMYENEFDELLKLAESAEGRVCVMVQNRTNACIEALKKMISNPEKTGGFISVNGFMTWQRDEEYYASGDWRGKWATEGGGLLINQAVHLIDMMGYLAGGIKSVRGSISTKWLEGVIEVEDTADALLEFSNGKRGCFYATNASEVITPFQLEVFFERMRYRYADGCLYEIENNGEFRGVVCRDTSAQAGKGVWGSGHERVIASFYGENDSCRYATLKDAENSMRALFAFYESAKNNGRKIVITHKKDKDVPAPFSVTQGD